MKGHKKRNQHYLTEKYLKTFCQDERIWLRDTEKREYRRERARNVARISHYYTKTKDGEHDYTIEEGLGDLESHAIPILIDLSESKQITLRSKFRFSLFAAFQSLRVPKYQRHVERVATRAMQQQDSPSIDNMMKTQLEQLIQEHGPLDLYPDDWRRTVTLQNVELSFERQFSLNEMIKNGVPLAKYLFSLNWAVLHVEGKSKLITSDNPFVLLRPTQLPKNAAFSVTTAGCGKFLPLTPECGLMIGDQNGHLLGHREMPDFVVDDFNRTIARQHFRYLFAREIDPLEKVREIADAANESLDVNYNRYRFD